MNEMYGDSGRVLNAKLMKIKELVRFPTKVKGGFLALCRSQIEWLIKLEVGIKGVITLGEEGEQLDRDAFGSNTITAIQNMFPIDMQEEMMEIVDPHEKDGREKLSLFLEYLKKVRRKRQVLQKTAENDSEGDFFDDDYEVRERDEYFDKVTALESDSDVTEEERLSDEDNFA